VASTEVLVVGGGITGVSLLHWLDRVGIRAELLEREQLASGATGHNAGFLISGVAANYGDAIQAYGRERTREVWNFTAENHALLRAALAGAEVGYRQRGSWTLAASDAEAKALRESESLMHEDGLAVSWSEATPYTGAGYCGGLLNPGDSEIDAAAAAAALAAPYQDRIHPAMAVQRIEPSGGEVLVETSTGGMTAQHVVLATNAYTQLLRPGIPIQPVRGQMLATEPLNVVVAERPVYAAYGYRYWRQRRDGTLLLGGFRDVAPGEEAGFEATPTERIQRRLDDHLQLLAPGAGVARRWAGIMGFTPDRLPLLGPVPGMSRVYISAGYSGHGLNFSCLAAKMLAEHLALATRPPAWMDPARFNEETDWRAAVKAT